MKNIFSLFLVALICSVGFAQQNNIFRIDSLPPQGILLDKGWKWQAGDNPDFAKADFNDSKWESIDPTKDIFDLQQLKKDGSIYWFRIKLKVDSSVTRQTVLQLQQSGASEIYLNGRLIKKIGTISTNPAQIVAFTPNLKPFSFPISQDREQIVACRYAFQPNISYGQHFGQTNKVIEAKLNSVDHGSDAFDNRLRDDRHGNLYVASFGILFFLFITFFLFFPNRKESLYFAIYAFLLSYTWTFFYQIHQPIEVSQIFLWINFLLILQSIAYVFSLLSIYEVLGQKRGWIFWFLAGFALFACFTGTYFYGWGWNMFGFVLINLINLDITRITLIAVRNHKKGAWILLVGGVIYQICWICFSLEFYQTFVISKYLPLSINFFLTSILSIPISFAIYFGYDFGLTNRNLQEKLKENEALSLEKQQILETQNETLEKQVTERTAELKLKNRDLEIEAALEKVRSRTMAMHQSEELAEVATLLYRQMGQLGGLFDRFSIGIINEPKGVVEIWATDQEGNLQEKVFIARLDEKTTIKKMYDSWKTGQSSLIIDLQGDEFQEWIRYAREEMGISVNEQQLGGRRISYLAFFSQGYLTIQSGKPIDPTIYELLKRFATVFNLTYTRFLDLQKAEAQLREAQIEAALEKVRSRSLAMQKSTELREVVHTVVERMTELGLNIASANIVLFNEQDKGIVCWTKTNTDDMYSNGFQWPYNDDPAVADFFDAIAQRTPLFTKNYMFDEKNAFWKNNFETSDFRNVPPDWEKFIFDALYFSLSLACRNKSGIVLTRYTQELFSDADHDILQRFATVFEQAYTRFLDLQKAEANEHEAIRQASLDRVRAEIASMRTKEDLQRITPLIWKELTMLTVPFIRCGVFIMDEATEKVHTYLSTPDGRAIASFDLPYTTPGTTPEVVAHWRNRQRFTDHWDEAQFQAWSQSLVEQGLIQSSESYMSDAPSQRLSLYFLPFRQGMLYVGNGTPLTNDEIQLAQVLADTFSTAYARYQDFNELEETKLQVEKAFAELKATQNQLIQKEKLASLGELTAGIAHEIQNPLNFVNNFSELSIELIEELKVERSKGKDGTPMRERDEALENELLSDLAQNQEKINLHGKRASSIVKGMLEHSRQSTGERELTDINQLADEYLRLAYHGLRAKDSSFNATLVTDFDSNLPKVEVIPQDIGRVLLNLYNNAFYAVVQKQKTAPADYKPTVSIQSQRSESGVEIRIRDNGVGIPDSVKAKIFQPFFTTKPTGEGTGLGLSLAYDIVTKGHGGTLECESVEGEGTTFTMKLPIQNQ